MYLLHTKRLELQQFFDDQIPPYAILSHTWGKEEPRLQDMHNDNIKRLHGYKKIEHAAKQAAQDGLEFVWIDTICIDKTSSAELSEAINSMFRWYAQSRVCYAYLEDVERSANFTESRWFTRGFTLQELLAPKQLVFYNKRWDWLGEKTTEYLVPKICMACGIFIEDQHVLTDFQPGKWSVATRMSWASTRQTTRREDIAYCLLGIFNINMPLLYGEGDRAFFRLQEEIMRVSDDRSLFAWVDEDIVDDSRTSLLARSPAQFAHTKNFKHGGDLRPFRARNQEASMVTVRGISLETSLVPVEDDPITYYAFIGYESKSEHPLGRPAIVVRRIFGDTFVRIYANTLPILHMPKVGRESRLQKLMFSRRSEKLRLRLKSESVTKSDAIIVDDDLLRFEGFKTRSVRMRPSRRHIWPVRPLKYGKTWKYVYSNPTDTSRTFELRITPAGISLSTPHEDQPSEGLHGTQILFKDIENNYEALANERCLQTNSQRPSLQLKDISANVVERKVPRPLYNQGIDPNNLQPGQTYTIVYRHHRFYTIQLRTRPPSLLSKSLKMLLYLVVTSLITLTLAALPAYRKHSTRMQHSPFPTNPLHRVVHDFYTQHVTGSNFWLSVIFFFVLPFALQPVLFIVHQTNLALRSLWTDYQNYS